jgi:hypothetical protein
VLVNGLRGAHHPIECRKITGLREAVDSILLSWG